MVHADPGYTTNVPLDDLLREDVLFADFHAPEPLTPEHGAPLRLVVPHLYGPGARFHGSRSARIWERAGYHSYADPFREQRYGGQSG